MNSQKVILTHGVFDLLHSGHLLTLNESKKLGNILIVGIDSDTLVKTLKGKNRPIIKDIDRLEIIKNIKAVDLAFLINPDKSELKELSTYFSQLYKYLGVDTITTGYPSKYDSIQRETCKQLGIQYLKVGKTVITNTTKIIKKIQSS